MALPFEVVEYNIDSLIRLLAEFPGIAPETVADKLHSTYFREYFNKLGARTVVVETEYVDRDFLEDFAAYYVRCFGDYPRKCSRLHFFSAAFTQDQFSKLLERQPGGITESKLQESYLGFVVIKPLPQTIVGRTCLTTYPVSDNPPMSGETRCFPATREYRANLFGIPLTVNSVAFQEQDRVVAACATSALWSVFQCTARLFDHYVPSPVEITKAASRGAVLDSRALPSAGLTSPQMAEAIRSLPLEPYLIAARNPNVLRATVYAYLRARVPVLLTIELRGIKLGQSEEFRGNHAVAIMGFSMRDSPLELSNDQSLQLISNRIGKIYAHDDQVGPFARMEFDTVEIEAHRQSGSGTPEWPASLTTSWGNAWTQYDKVNATPINMLVPLYHKIRIPFATVHDSLLRLDGLLETIRSQNLIPLSQRIVWDIHLITVNDLKSEFRYVNGVSAVQRRELLTAHLPRFIWRAKAFCGATPLIDLLFDATDIEQGDFFLKPVVYDDSFGATMHMLATSDQIRKPFTGVSDRIFKHFEDWHQPTP